MSKRIASRTDAHHEHVLAPISLHDRPTDVERIPAREKLIDLESPGQRQSLGENPRFDLWNIDRFLLLENAGLHAVVADAVPGSRAHWIVDGDEGHGAEELAGLTHRVHFADFFAKRAPRQRDSQRVSLELTSFGVEQSLAARVLVAVVTKHAVVDLLFRLA